MILREGVICLGSINKYIQVVIVNVSGEKQPYHGLHSFFLTLVMEMTFKLYMVIIYL